VAPRLIGKGVSAQKLSIVARGRQLGTAADMLTDRDAVMHARSDLERQLVALLAGTASELIAFGEGGGELFLGAGLQALGSAAPDTLNIIDEEPEGIVEEAKARARHVL